VNRLLRRGQDPDNGYMDYVMTGDASRHVSLIRAGARRAVATVSGVVAGS
jgi:hypothetical protein